MNWLIGLSVGVPAYFYGVYRFARLGPQLEERWDWEADVRIFYQISTALWPVLMPVFATVAFIMLTHNRGMERGKVEVKKRVNERRYDVDAMDEVRRISPSSEGYD